MLCAMDFVKHIGLVIVIVNIQVAHHSEGGSDILDNVWQFPTQCKLTIGGWEYAGQVNVTRTGIPCQPWASMQPHYNYYADSTVFPEGSAAGAGSNCRNPDYNWAAGAWCYTMDRSVRWQKCNVSFCECKMRQNGTDYEGQISVTMSGRTCQDWVSQSPHRHRFRTSDFLADGTLSRASNFCRNPNATQPGGPWCYTNDPDVEWEYCNVSSCDMLFVARSTTANPQEMTSPTVMTTVTTVQTTTRNPTTVPVTTERSVPTEFHSTAPGSATESAAATVITGKQGYTTPEEASTPTAAYTELKTSTQDEHVDKHDDIVREASGSGHLRGSSLFILRLLTCSAAFGYFRWPRGA